MIVQTPLNTRQLAGTNTRQLAAVLCFVKQHYIRNRHPAAAGDQQNLVLASLSKKDTSVTKISRRFDKFFQSNTN